MSSRVRTIISHPDYQTYFNEKGHRTIESLFAERESERVQPYARPEGFEKFPRWKRVKWMAAFLNGWTVKIFREPKKTRPSRSRYRKTAEPLGFEVGRRRPQKKALMDYENLLRRARIAEAVPQLNAVPLRQRQARVRLVEREGAI